MSLVVYGRLGRDVRQIEIVVEHLLSATAVTPEKPAPDSTPDEFDDEVSI